MRVAKFSSVMVAAALGLSMAAAAEAGTVTGPAIATFTTADSSKDIVLTQATPTWSADLTTYNSFIANVHSLIGYDTNGAAGVGFADVTHQTGPTDTVYGDTIVPYAMVGSLADGNLGGFIYKFTVAPGYKTGTGGTISTDVYFRGTPSLSSAEWIGVSTSLQVAANLTQIDNPNDFTKTTMSSLFSDPFNTYYKNPLTIAIPEGATEFYVAVNDAGSSSRLAISSLNVNSNLVAVPEPASLSLLALGAAACVRRRRRGDCGTGL